MVKAVLSELVVESYIVTDETKSVSPQVYEEFKSILSKENNKGNALVEKCIPHVDMKNLWLNGALNGEEVKVLYALASVAPIATLPWLPA